MLRQSFLFIARQLSLSCSKYESVNLPTTLVQFTCRQSVTPLQVTTVRNYVKTKDLRKDKKKRIQIYENELQEVVEVESLYKDLAKPVETFKEDLFRYATLRSLGALENFEVEFEGHKYVIQDLAEISKKGNNLYVLDFRNFPQTLTTVVDDLQKSELNLNVQQEGSKVYVPIPKVTKEHRENLAKKSKALFIKCKDNIRKNQFKYIKDLGKIENLSEEVKLRVSEQINALGDKQIQAAENILKIKEKELLREN